MTLTRILRRLSGGAGRLAGVLFAAMLFAIGLPGAVPAQAGPVEDLIRQAGSAEDDAVRLEILKRLQASPGLDAKLRRDVDSMVAAVER